MEWRGADFPQTLTSNTYSQVMTYFKNEMYNSDTKKPAYVATKKRKYYYNMPIKANTVLVTSLLIRYLSIVGRKSRKTCSEKQTAATTQCKCNK